MPMPQAVKNPDFDSKQRATLSINMSCEEWDKIGAVIAGMNGETFQSTADAILLGLIEVGFYEWK